MRGWIGIAMFLTLLIVVTGGVNFYIYRRMVSSLAIESQTWLWVLRVSFILLATSYLTARILLHSSINVVSVSWFWVGSLWLGLAFYLFLLCLITQFISGVLQISGAYKPIENALGLNIGIAGFILVLGSALFISGFAFREANGKADTPVLEVPVKKLPRELDGFSIAQITDLHLDVVMSPAWVKRMVDQVNSLNPDLIVITGDLIDEDPDRSPQIFEQLKRMNSRYGVLAVTGNHEFYVGVNRVVRHALDANIRYLRNEKVVIAGSLNFYGIDDPSVKYRFGGELVPFEKVIGPEAKVEPAILLYHRPAHIEKLAGLGIDLVLCGHTHNGQLWPFVYVVRRFFPRVTGHFTVGNSHLYVSRGTGTWGPPMRFGSPPEITKIVLRSK